MEKRREEKERETVRVQRELKKGQKRARKFIRRKVRVGNIEKKKYKVDTRKEENCKVKQVTVLYFIYYCYYYYFFK